MSATPVEPAARFLVVGSRPWSRRAFDDVIRRFPGEWEYTASPEQLQAACERNPAPRRIFFLHWSTRVPAELLQRFECIGFHMTDLPYGRGGSPLQNLILRGHRTTRLTAFRMTEELDAGPIYLQEELSLEGGAEEIYLRGSFLAAGMIRRLAAERIEPAPQVGEVVRFSRRRPSESEIPDLPTLEDLHDFLRMLDAEGYPRACVTRGAFRFEFRRPALYDGRIEADVIIRRCEPPDEAPEEAPKEAPR